ncbi:hypothetical protein D3C84_1273940 [compost metagenome]
MRQPKGGDEGADQSLAGEVDPFTEGAAEHGEAYALAADFEALHEGVALGLVHLPAL